MRVAIAGWILVGITSILALVSVVVYLATGEFSRAWLIVSACVYAAVALAAIVLAAIDRAPATAHAARASDAAPAGEPKLVARDTIYATRAGSAVRLTYRTPDDRVELRYVAMTSSEMLSDQEIVTRVDALPPAEEPADLDDAVDEAIERRSAPETTKKETA